MRQLSGIDVSFLNMETPSTFGHVASLNIFDPAGAPGGAGLEATKQIILERIDLLAPFRRRLVEVPLGLDLPYWIEDPEFDIDFHVRHHAVPPPGTAEQLADVISRIVARPLDRSRPLWELYVIEGVENGTLIAQLTKVHHAAIDGASGAGMLAAILDRSPDHRPTGLSAPWQPDVVPTDEQMLRITAGQYIRRPEKMIRLSVRSLRELAASTQNGGLRVLADMIAQPMPGRFGRMLRERLRGVNHDVDDPPALPPTQAPRTPWNRPITPHRRFANTTIPLDEAKRVRRQFGCTFNDVVMALCSGSIRRYLLAHDCLPTESLIAMVPVSVRSGNEDDAYQNRVSGLLADLATNEPDPVKRLRRVQASMRKAKDNLAAIPAETLQDFAQFAPPAIAARAMRMYSRLRIADRMNPPFNLIISNVPGPNYPLYSAGAKLKHFYPVSALGDGQGLNMTVQSYNGNLDFGFIACRDLVPDLWTMMDYLNETMTELLSFCDPLPGADVAPIGIPDGSRSTPAQAKADRAWNPTHHDKQSVEATARRRAPDRQLPVQKVSADATMSAVVRQPSAKKAPAANETAAAEKAAVVRKVASAKKTPRAAKSAGANGSASRQIAPVAKKAPAKKAAAPARAIPLRKPAAR